MGIAGLGLGLHVASLYGFADGQFKQHDRVIPGGY